MNKKVLIAIIAAMAVFGVGILVMGKAVVDIGQGNTSVSGNTSSNTLKISSSSNTISTDNVGEESFSYEQALKKIKTADKYEAVFMLDGVLYRLPCPLSKFEENGWQVSDADKEKIRSQKLGGGASSDYIELTRADDKYKDSSIGIVLKNEAEESSLVPMSECLVYLVNADISTAEDKNDNVEVILKGGLTITKEINADIVKELCGEPTQEDEGYHQPVYSVEKITKGTSLSYPTFSITINTDSNESSRNYNYHNCAIYPAAVIEESISDEKDDKLDVILQSSGEDKIQVIKIIREITGLGLSESQALVNAAPIAVKKDVSREDAEAIMKQLMDAGAEVEIK